MRVLESQWSRNGRRAIWALALISLVSGCIGGEGTDPRDAELRAMAVRALGRLEDPDSVEVILPYLSAADPHVRAEAANALGQAVYSAPGDSVAALLLAHLSSEEDPQVRGIVMRTLGRLRYQDPSVLPEVEAALLATTSTPEGDATYPELLGASMGLDWMVRNHRGMALSQPTISRLRALASYEGGPGGPASADGARLRRVAFSALAAGGEPGKVSVQTALNDQDPDMRRLAAAALRQDRELGGLEALDAYLEDPVARVRAQAVTTYAAMASDNERCGMLLRMTADPDPGVAVAALDLLARPCPDLENQVRGLKKMAADPEAQSPDQWHRAAHALLSLASISPVEASAFLPAFAGHINPFARVYAARSATLTGDREILETLVEDDVPNVRTAAMEGLFHLQGHEADGVILGQLQGRDPLLLMTAAGLLEGTPNPHEAVAPLLEVFHRVSAEGKMTDRDPRMALLRRLAEVGTDEELEGLAPYLSDHDPAVADYVAEILTRSGTTREASPNPIPFVPVPSPSELERLVRTRVILEMEGGREIEIRLFPYLAPSNAARFVHLAEEGVFHGLTFHRVVSNFVVQGLSPTANEMAGHGPFTRDEIGLQSNWRGTVGTSTRGRDTGDGQIYINLVDNLRLDHNYTIFGEVVSGMDVVDRIVEGQVVQGVRVHRTP